MIDKFVNADIRTAGRRDSLINEWFSIENYYRNPELVATYVSKLYIVDLKKDLN
ncbi:MAG: hypothetical protein MJZ95_00640 [Paludibacteraceae bacterium]|nr:hypothetical protein [Paludibacteraceae bacterium]